MYRAMVRHVWDGRSVVDETHQMNVNPLETLEAAEKYAAQNQQVILGCNGGHYEPVDGKQYRYNRAGKLESIYWLEKVTQ